MALERMFRSVEDPKVHSLLFAHSFEAKIGRIDFGLASLLEDQTGVGSSPKPHYFTQCSMLVAC